VPERVKQYACGRPLSSSLPPDPGNDLPTRPRPRTPGVDLARVSLSQKHQSCNFTHTSNDKITPSPSERTPAALMRPQCLSARRRRTRADCSRARCGLGDTTHGWYGSSDKAQNQRQQLTDCRGASHLRVRRGDLLLAPRLRQHRHLDSTRHPAHVRTGRCLDSLDIRGQETGRRADRPRHVRYRQERRDFHSRVRAARL
jgi:hypothetical protein